MNSAYRFDSIYNTNLYIVTVAQLSSENSLLVTRSPFFPLNTLRIYFEIPIENHQSHLLHANCEIN